ncbi:preprotein translocase subunit SecE [Spiroplasma chrysopicola]|uniref:Preprotein translocase subunit SecE n=1 Tax=Spiroplasma chrysopicola DF-1 TaxID=1276227 RepID=R4UHD0_9MOLU|nr:preprotein translocase subunit SecE [Spiroplasma chrysopicola]AGM24736.1 hypothetical protein SCHRY_v1c01510 [Spiroplasma chrysopicola DF-1]
MVKIDNNKDFEQEVIIEEEIIEVIVDDNKARKPKTKLSKEAKKAEKVARKNAKAAQVFQRQQAAKASIHVGKKGPADLAAPDGSGKKSFFNRKTEKKKKAEKVNWKLAFREFPVKMAKEVSRIRWASKGSLGRKFLITIAFIAVFAIFYLALDQVLFNLLHVAKII